MADNTPGFQRSRRRLYEAPADHPPAQADALVQAPEPAPDAEPVLPPARVLHPQRSRQRPQAASTVHGPQINNLRHREALQLVEQYRTRAIRQGMLPLPGLDLALVLRLQWDMLRELADRYGVRLSEGGTRSALEYALEGYGLASASGSLIGSALKWIPLVGSFAGMTSVAAAAGASTRAIGKALIEHLEAHPAEEELDEETLRLIFQPASSGPEQDPPSGL
jgi:uncharacterized protein (DUF697 family)